jgi:hypothetical protein
MIAGNANSCNAVNAEAFPALSRRLPLLNRGVGSSLVRRPMMQCMIKHLKNMCNSYQGFLQLDRRHVSTCHLLQHTLQATAVPIHYC